MPFRIRPPALKNSGFLRRRSCKFGSSVCFREFRHIHVCHSFFKPCSVVKLTEISQSLTCFLHLASRLSLHVRAPGFLWEASIRVLLYVLLLTKKAR
jgi:hypothetical protein